VLVGGDLDVTDDALAAQQLLELFELGVTHIVDCRLEADEQELFDGIPEIAYLHAGMDDAGQAIPDSWFDETVGWVLDALSAPDARVLTHCHMGINRGPSLGYAVLLALGWDAVAAIDAIRSARPIANVWYAEQALAWHHRRVDAPAERRRDDTLRLRGWRDSHPLDVVRVIADQRRRGL
jgi:protein-tyrosine phosphatase